MKAPRTTELSAGSATAIVVAWGVRQAGLEVPQEVVAALGVICGYALRCMSAGWR